MIIIVRKIHDNRNEHKRPRYARPKEHAILKQQRKGGVEETRFSSVQNLIIFNQQRAFRHPTMETRAMARVNELEEEVMAETADEDRGRPLPISCHTSSVNANMVRYIGCNFLEKMALK